MTRILVKVSLLVLLSLAIASCDSFGGDSDQERTERDFCESAEEWHTTFSAWLRRLNSLGSRDGDGLRLSYDVLKANLLTVLKDAGNDKQEALRELLRAITRNAELWMSELSQYDDVLTLLGEAQSPDPAVRVALLNSALEANRRAELTRIEGNNLDREASYQLTKLCDLPPLPIYSP